MGCGSGEVWNPEVIADRIRRGLDVIGDTVGSLLYRGLDYWEILEPGTEGQTLNVGATGLPEWGPGLANEITLGNVCPAAGATGIPYELYFDSWGSVPAGPKWSVANGSGGAPQPTITAVSNVLKFTLTINANTQNHSSFVNFIQGNATADNTPCGIFSSVVWLGQTNGRFTTGPCIGINGSNAGVMCWDLIGNRVLNGATTVIASVPAVAVNDVCMLSVRLLSSTVRICECWKNGVVIASTTTVSMPATPSPTRLGLMYRGNNALPPGLTTHTAQFGRWSGGVI